MWCAMPSIIPARFVAVIRGWGTSQSPTIPASLSLLPDEMLVMDRCKIAGRASWVAAAIVLEVDERRHCCEAGGSDV